MVGGSQSSKQRGLNVLIENLSFFIILYYKKWHSCVKRKIAISNVFSLKRTTSEKSRRQWTLHSFWGRPIASFFSELTCTYHAVSGFLCFLVWEKNAILWKKGTILLSLIILWLTLHETISVVFIPYSISIHVGDISVIINIR